MDLSRSFGLTELIDGNDCGDLLFDFFEEGELVAEGELLFVAEGELLFVAEGELGAEGELVLLFWRTEGEVFEKTGSAGKVSSPEGLDTEVAEDEDFLLPCTVGDLLLGL